jgi:hypothetical protein
MINYGDILTYLKTGAYEELVPISITRGEEDWFEK